MGLTDFLLETRSTEPRLETKISMNFVPWESFDLGPQTEGHSAPARGSLKLKRAKGGIQTTQKVFQAWLELVTFIFKIPVISSVFCIPPKVRETGPIKEKYLDENQEIEKFQPYALSNENYKKMDNAMVLLKIITFTFTLSTFGFSCPDGIMVLLCLVILYKNSPFHYITITNN